MSNEPRKGLPPDSGGGLESFSINKPTSRQGSKSVKGLPPDPAGGIENLTHHHPQQEEVNKATEDRLSSSDTHAEAAPELGPPAIPVPTKLSGDWFHSHQEERIVRAITNHGWRPDLNTGTKFGCGVYLARGQWHPDAKWLIRCRVNLRDDEVLDVFPTVSGFESHGQGNSERHFERYLVSEGVVSGRPKADRGDCGQNRSIRDFFLNKGIKAVMFIEHGNEVIVVYDASAIEIVDVQRA